MKYDKKVAEAIRGSQDKWIGIAYEGKVDHSAKDCALCRLFHNTNECPKCPIGIAGHACNVDYPNPYEEWDDTVEMEDESVVFDDDSQATAIQMLDYLLHLEQWYELTAERDNG